MDALLRADRNTFEARIRPLREFAEEQGCSAIVLVDALNQYWASGYNVNRDASNWERPCALVLPLSGEPVFLLNEICAPHVHLAIDAGWCWVQDVQFYLEHPRQENRGPTILEWGYLLRKVLESRGLVGTRLACDNPSFCLYWMGRDADSIELLDASEQVRRARMIKDEVEISAIRNAATLTDDAMASFHELIRPGQLTMDVATEVQRRLSLAAVERFPEARVEARVSVTTGPDTACVNGPYGFSGRRFTAGDSVVTIVILALNGYAAENERTFMVDHCPDEKLAFFQTAIEAQAAGREAAVAGRLICDIDSASIAVIEKAGMGQYAHHRTGHGIGLSGHEPPGDMAFNYERLEPGMLFTVEPGIYVPGVGGFRHSDTVLIGETPDSLTRAERSVEGCTIRA